MISFVVLETMSHHSHLANFCTAPGPDLCFSTVDPENSAYLLTHPTKVHSPVSSRPLPSAAWVCTWHHITCTTTGSAVLLRGLGLSDCSQATQGPFTPQPATPSGKAAPPQSFRGTGAWPAPLPPPGSCGCHPAWTGRLEWAPPLGRHHRQQSAAAARRTLHPDSKPPPVPQEHADHPVPASHPLAHMQMHRYPPCNRCGPGAASPTALPPLYPFGPGATTSSSPEPTRTQPAALYPHKCPPAASWELLGRCCPAHPARPPRSSEDAAPSHWACSGRCASPHGGHCRGGAAPPLPGPGAAALGAAGTPPTRAERAQYLVRGGPSDPASRPSTHRGHSGSRDCGRGCELSFGGTVGAARSAGLQAPPPALASHHEGTGPAQGYSQVSWGTDCPPATTHPGSRPACGGPGEPTHGA